MKYIRMLIQKLKGAKRIQKRTLLVSNDVADVLANRKPIRIVASMRGTNANIFVHYADGECDYLPCFNTTDEQFLVDREALERAIVRD